MVHAILRRDIIVKQRISEAIVLEFDVGFPRFFWKEKLISVIRLVA